MNLSPHRPRRPLFWPDAILELQGLLADNPTPVYIVGGAVRDAYLHRPIKDVDLATPDESISLARQLANRLRGDVFILDSERGVARVFVDLPDGRLTLDVARFRGSDLAADLHDRDFTINAMAVNPSEDLGVLIDPLNGEEDAFNKVIRRCAPHSISDDPIRALRAVRQSVQLGMRIEAKTISDIRTYGQRLIDTSAERVRDELVNLLNVQNPAAALRVAQSLGLLELVLPGIQQPTDPPENGFNRREHTLAVIDRLASILLAISPARTDNTAATFHLGVMVIQLDRFRARLQDHIHTAWPNERPHRALLVLAALLHFGGDPVACETRADTLRLSATEKKRLTTLVQHSLSLPATDRRSIHRFWYPLGAAGVDICLLALAHYLGTTDISQDQNTWLTLVNQVGTLLEAYYERYDKLVAPPPFLDGNELIQALDLEPGPIVGQLINLIREEQAVGEVQSAEDVLRIARGYLGRQG